MREPDSYLAFNPRKSSEVFHARGVNLVSSTIKSNERFFCADFLALLCWRAMSVACNVSILNMANPGAMGLQSEYTALSQACDRGIT